MVSTEVTEGNNILLDLLNSPDHNDPLATLSMDKKRGRKAARSESTALPTGKT